MKIVAIVFALALLLPSVAEAAKRKKPMKCTSYTFITGTTKTTCR